MTDIVCKTGSSEQGRLKGEIDLLEFEIFDEAKSILVLKLGVLFTITYAYLFVCTHTFFCKKIEKEFLDIICNMH